MHTLPLAGLARHWAAVTLVAGRAPFQRWSIDGERDAARVVVGGGAACDWRVEADGVEEAHLELQWDGQSLWLLRVGASLVRVNGQVLDQPCAVTRTTWIELGAAVMIADGSATPAHLQAPEAARRSGLPDFSGGERASVPTLLLPFAELTTTRPSEPATALHAARSSVLRAPQIAVGELVQHAPRPLSEKVTTISAVSAASPANADGTPMQAAVPVFGKAALGMAVLERRDTLTNLSVPAGERSTSASRRVASSQTSVEANVSESYGGSAIAAFEAGPVRLLRLFRQRRVRLTLMATLALTSLLLCLRAQVQAPAAAHAREAGARAASDAALRPASESAGSVQGSDTRSGPLPAATAASQPLLDAQARLRARTAGELLGAGRYEEALPIYAALAHETRSPVFATIVRVLTQRVRERCREREEAGGTPCE